MSKQEHVYASYAISIQYYLYVLLVINMYNEFSDLNLHVGETIWTIKNG